MAIAELGSDCGQDDISLRMPGAVDFNKGGHRSAYVDDSSSRAGEFGITWSAQKCKISAAPRRAHFFFGRFWFVVDSRINDLLLQPLGEIQGFAVPF